MDAENGAGNDARNGADTAGPAVPDQGTTSGVGPDVNADRHSSVFGIRAGGEDGAFDVVMEASGLGPDPSPSARASRVRRVVVQLHQDAALEEASGRWRWDAPEPDTFVPGDVPAVRGRLLNEALHGADAHRQLMEEKRSLTPEERAEWTSALDYQVGIGGLLASAVPYFLAADETVLLLEAAPPAADLVDEIRLPFPALFVCFGADLELADRLLQGPPGETSALDRRCDGPQAADGLDRLVFDDDREAQLVEQGGFLTGLVLLADEDGRLRDEVGFVIRFRDSADPPDPVPRRTVVFGNRRAARVGFVVHNVAAALAWAAWDQPAATFALPDHDHPDFARTVNTGRFRRQEPRGALAGVRVLDLDRTTKASGQRRDTSDGPARRPPGRHWRAAHWQRVRVGPRDDWHYEGRLNGPQLINPGQPAAATTTVRTRRVPERPSAPPEAGEDSDARPED